MKKLFTLLALAALLLCGCADSGNSADTPTPDSTTAVTTTATTTASTADSRDVLIRPENFSDVRLEAQYAVWAAIKDDVDEDVTINDLQLLNVLKYKDAYILRYQGCPGPAPAPMEDSETILTYEFRYGYVFGPFKVFTNGEFFTLQEALDNGFYTEDDIRAIWEMHKEAASPYYAEE